MEARLVWQGYEERHQGQTSVLLVRLGRRLELSGDTFYLGEYVPDTRGPRRDVRLITE